MSRLFSSQQPSAGQRFYFALDSAPGFVVPGVATLTLGGQVPAAAQPTTVFRTPTPATLTIGGLAAAAPVALSPAPAALNYVGQVPARQLIRTITPALAPPDYGTPPDNAPTLITIWTTLPGVGLLTLQALPLNLTQGGNIGFVSPTPAQLSLGTLPYSLLLLAGGAGVGTLSIIGLAPTVKPERTIMPDVGVVSIAELFPTFVLPFTWVDDDPAPTSSWITDAAA